MYTFGRAHGTSVTLSRLKQGARALSRSATGPATEVAWQTTATKVARVPHEEARSITAQTHAMGGKDTSVSAVCHAISIAGRVCFLTLSGGQHPHE